MHVHDHNCRHRHKIDRRSFGKIMGLGLGASLATVASPLRASGQAKALMLSCMDYRLVDDLVVHMQCRGLQEEYDHVVLAGAALGVIAPDFAGWHQVFWDHLDLAIKLHGIEEVVVIDHRDCGAFKLVMGEAAVATPEDETRTHTLVLTQFAAEVATRHPELAVQAFLMGLDGFAERVALPTA